MTMNLHRVTRVEIKWSGTDNLSTTWLKILVMDDRGEEHEITCFPVEMGGRFDVVVDPNVRPMGAVPGVLAHADQVHARTVIDLHEEDTESAT